MQPVALTETAAAVKLPAAAAASPGAFARSLRILLAEDNLVNQKLAVLLLEKHEHLVTVVDNGEKAVRAYQSQPFDLVLMDVQMPVMDGLAAVAEIRRLERRTGSRMPIVAMTAHAMKGDRDRCIEAGMDGYVSKPIHPQELYGEIARCHAARHSSAEAAAADPQVQAPVRIDPASAVPSPNGDAELLAIDWETALHHTGGDRALMQTMIEVFLAESPKMLAEVQAAIAAGDAPRLRRAGHSLKGSCGYFAAENAYHASLAVEQLGQDGKLAEAQFLVEELTRQIHRLTPALAEFRP